MKGFVMLVLSRKLNEEICIGPNVSVRIVEIKGNKVRLGVIAPKDMSVHRAEVVEKVNAEVAAAEEALRAVVWAEVPALPFDHASAEVMRPCLGAVVD